MAGLNSSRSCGLRRLVRGRIPDLPFLPKTFDAIVCLDVLYYEDISREDALRRFAELLRPGGMLVMNLPAFSCLRGRHDLAVGIHGRFRKRSVDAMLAEAGFDEASSSYWNTSLFMPILIWRWLSRLWPGEVESDVGLSPGWVNRVLRGSAPSSASVNGSRCLSAPPFSPLQSDGRSAVPGDASPPRWVSGHRAFHCRHRDRHLARDSYSSRLGPLLSILRACRFRGMRAWLRRARRSGGDGRAAGVPQPGRGPVRLY
jgi:hypothetical protein